LLLYRAKEGAKLGTMVWLFRESSIAKTANSLYASKNVNKPVVITPGHITGMIASQRAWKRVQPSTTVLLSSSVGIVWNGRGVTGGEGKLT
jgi:heme/copper-type cytochrome/quinol oxidase subunit 3